MSNYRINKSHGEGSNVVLSTSGHKLIGMVHELCMRGLPEDKAIGYVASAYHVDYMLLKAAVSGMFVTKASLEDRND